MDSIQDAYDAFLAMPLENKVWVDNTASAEVAAVTIQALRDGISVVCSNKIAATESMDHWRSIQRASRTGQVFFQHETNVGAGTSNSQQLARHARNWRSNSSHRRSAERIVEFHF
jgi:homoserine dehydrogenase